MNNERLQTVSTMRVMAMLMIIIFHSMLFYTGNWWIFGGPKIPLWIKASTFFDTIDLPMFVFISGFLFGYLYKYKNKYRNKMQFIVGKVKRLLIPYFFWGLFLVFILPPYNHLGELLTGISHLWFLLMLFDIFMAIMVMVGILFHKDSFLRWVLVFIGSILLFCTFHVFSTHHHFLCLHSALYYVPAFILGMSFSCFQLYNHISARATAIVLILAVGSLGWYVSLSPDLPYFANYTIRIITGYTIVASIFVLLCKKIKLSKKVSAVIAHFDRLSMGIYIFNQITINIFLSIPYINEWLKDHFYVGVPIIFIVSLIAPWLLSLPFNRFKWLKWTIG